MNTHCGKNKRSTESGFTLMELMVVIVILGILASIVVPRFLDEPQKARVIKVKMQIQGLSTAAKKFYLDNGFYPSTEQGLQALVEKPTIGRIPKHYPSNGYIAKIPSDPWENEYVYIAPGEHEAFEIISFGADGEEGGENDGTDIQSWNIE
ncbi:type II secretion system major pseudopilin GspG [Halodesulfovibrio marinisediminis]|uniref:Type II secretion system core protein G n=1 Tax=Halodesulfovibrio marinisediminis DSM 17456 TaxID=1121457 RepID=A0A1N6H066_9BACT|nr:type II secretion system major pseudopilin GspG [Halodesulfovibrio marinisediminis]SIO13190.1 general secretion pathway protein G [Halodesulfovibrio marinisediminis DSM 17456]